VNILHCNECNGTEDVTRVVVLVESQVPILNEDGEETGLAKNDSTKVTGDLCARCLKVVTDAVSEETGFGFKLTERGERAEVT
jgi:hypothetical protein